MIDDDLISHVAKLKDDCRAYLDEQESERTRAQEYYRGEMKDMPVPTDSDGKPLRSSVVSQDLRHVMKKVMPSIKRTLLKSDDMVKYEPVGPGDEEGAEQASEYVNHVVVPESDMKRAMYDAIQDAGIVKTGILKWSAYQLKKATVYDYTEQPGEILLGLEDDPANTVMDLLEEPETDPQALQMNPEAKRVSFKLKRIEEKTCIRLEAVKREMFLITPGAESIEDAEMVGDERHLTRSDLVAEGYDKKAVWRLSSWSEDDEGDQRARMGVDWTERKEESRKAMQEVVVWEVYVKIDSDDDGIAELHRIVFGEGPEGKGKSTHIVLGHEMVAEAPYSEIVVERDAHQFEGHSVDEDAKDVMRVKTQLLRGAMDNIYAHNNPRPIVDEGAVEDPEALHVMEFGLPVKVKNGRNVNEVVRWDTMPFVADKSFSMLEYWDEIARDRTGITDASAGLDASEVQNVNTGVAALLSESGIAEADDRITTIAEGLKRAFRGILKLVIAHADRERTILINGEWKTYDPRVWNVDMDCVVNVGLGGGTKERDLAVLQMILGLQKDVLMSMGPEVGQMFVNAEQLGTTLHKIVETAGFPTAEPFFSKPDPQQVQQAMQQASQSADPEAGKAQAQMQIEQMKAQLAMQMKQMEVQASAANEDKKQETQRAKEQAQMEADIVVKRAEIEAEDRRYAQEVELKREEMAQAWDMKVAEIAAQDRQAERQAEAAREAAKQKPEVRTQ